MKKSKLFRICTLLMCGVSIFTISCDKDDKDAGSTKETIDELVYSLPEPLQEIPHEKDEPIGDAIGDFDESTYTYCECQKYKASTAFDDVMLLDPKSSVIYPGSIIDGNSVTDGSYRQIVLPRAPLTVSTSFLNLNGLCSRTVENPSLSTMRSAEKEMLYDTDINGSTMADLTFQIEEVHSSDQLQLAVGASASYKKAKLESHFDFNKKTNGSRLLVKFIQVYYSIDVDAPSSPAKFFDPSVTVSDFQKAVGNSSALPVYVSSVQYGRVAYFGMESEECFDSVKTSLETTLKSKVVGAKLESALNNNKYTKNIKTSGTIIGGSGEDAVQVVNGISGMIDFITNGGNFSKTSPAAPIAFTLAKLSDNEIFNVVNSTEYVSRKCKSSNASIVPKYFYGIKGDNDVYGQIKVRLCYDKDELDSAENAFYVFNKDRDEKVTVKVGEKVALEFSNDVTLKLDQNKIDDAWLRVDVNLFDFDANCSCGRSGNDDTYNPISKTYKLKDIMNGSSEVTIDSEGNVVIDNIHCTVDKDNGHETYRAFGKLGKKRTKHNAKTMSTDDRIKFAFKINL